LQLNLQPGARKIVQISPIIAVSIIQGFGCIPHVVVSLGTIHLLGFIVP